MNDSGSHGRLWREVGPYFSLGSHFALTMLASIGLGYWADDRWETSPVLLLIGACVGAGAAFRQMYYALKRANRPRKQSFNDDSTTDA
jgi:F0F1-type ATP synthase assembly protein I